MALKKILVLTVVLSLFAFVGCKKETNDYLCSCNYYQILLGPGGRTHEINDATLEDAKEKCKQYREDYTNLAGRQIDCGLMVQ